VSAPSTRLWQCGLAALAVATLPACSTPPDEQLRTCGRGAEPRVDSDETFVLSTTCHGGAEVLARYTNARYTQAGCDLTVEGACTDDDLVLVNFEVVEGERFWDGASAQILCGGPPTQPTFVFRIPCDPTNGCIRCEGTGGFGAEIPCRGEKTGDETVCTLSMNRPQSPTGPDAGDVQ
jgi:uncharacterized protein YuzB (UPF0349 family)